MKNWRNKMEEEEEEDKNFTFTPDSTFTEYLEYLGLDQSAYDALTPEEQEEIMSTFNTGMMTLLAKSVKNSVKKEDLVKIQNKLTELSEKHIKQLYEILKNQGVQIQKMIEGGRQSNPANKAVEEIKSKKAQLINIAKTRVGEVELKAVTNRASVGSSTAAVRLEDIGQLGVKNRSLYDVLPKITIADGDNQGIVRYIDWNEDTTVRAAAMRAEGVAFPESTAKFTEFSIPLRKIGDTLPVTEEFMEDEVRLSQELPLFIETNVNTVVDAQLINGDNTGQNLKGMLNSVPAYTPVAEGIPAANRYDLFTRVKTNITFNRGSKYSPDMVLANADELDQLRLTKDANNNYIFRDLERVGSLTLIEDNNMPANQAIVGDSRFARIYEKAGVVISTGQVDDQFNEDLLTLKARKRLLLLIRNVDATGFRKITDVEAALAVLTSQPS